MAFTNAKMILWFNRRRHRALLVAGCLAITYCVYKVLTAASIYQSIQSTNTGELKAVGKHHYVGEPLSSYFIINASFGQDTVVINGYTFNTDFFPNWFWTSTIGTLSKRLVPQSRKMSPRVPFFDKANRPSRGGSWVRFNDNIRASYMYDPDDPTLTTLLQDMAYSPIVAIYNNDDGTQLKMNVQFKDGGMALLKPKRQIYRNADRHFAEIAASYLDRLLGFSRVPPTVGRYVNIRKELLPLLPDALRQTVFTTKDGRVCFYGQCASLCEKKLSSCGEPDYIEVSLSHLLPNATHGDRVDLKQISNPWMKNWLGTPNPDWISEDHLCSKTRGLYRSGSPLYLELLDALYFDILIDNPDRRSFVLYGHSDSSTVPVLIDQGKGFRRFCKDEFLTEFLFERGGCCLMKKSTFLKLVNPLLVANQGLGSTLGQFSRDDPIAPVLAEGHLIALSRRLNKTVYFITECLKRHHVDDVIVDDL